MIHEVLGPTSGGLLARLFCTWFIMYHSSAQLLVRFTALANPNSPSSRHLQKLMVYQIKPLGKIMIEPRCVSVSKHPGEF